MILITGINENELIINGDGSCEIQDFTHSLENDSLLLATTPKLSTFITLSGSLNDLVSVYHIINNSARTIQLHSVDLLAKQHTASAGAGIATTKIYIARSNMLSTVATGLSLNPASTGGIEGAATGSQKLHYFDNLAMTYGGSNVTSSLGFFEPLGSFVYSGFSLMSSPFSIEWEDNGPEFRPSESFIIFIKNLAGAGTLASITVSGCLQFSFVEEI